MINLFSFPKSAETFPAIFQLVPGFLNAPRSFRSGDCDCPNENQGRTKSNVSEEKKLLPVKSHCLFVVILIVRMIYVAMPGQI